MDEKVMEKVNRFVKILRRNPTRAERAMWGYLRRKPFKLEFVRQHPIGRWVADFYCESLKLVIEIDGPGHHSKEGGVRDLAREDVMAQRGIVTLRFSNEEALCKIEQVDEEIGAILRYWRRSGHSYPHLAHRNAQATPARKQRGRQELTGFPVHSHKCGDGTNSYISLSQCKGEGSVFASEEIAQRTAAAFGREAFQCRKGHWHVRFAKRSAKNS